MHNASLMHLTTTYAPYGLTRVPPYDYAIRPLSNSGPMTVPVFRVGFFCPSLQGASLTDTTLVSHQARHHQSILDGRQTHLRGRYG